MVLSSVTLPSQVNLRLSNSALSTSGEMPMLRENVPNTEPSFARDRIDEIGRAQAAGAGHLLGNDRGIARNVLAEIAAEQPRIGVVAAADAVADDQRDVAALVEIFDAGGAGQTAEQRRATKALPIVLLCDHGPSLMTPNDT